MRWVVGGLVVNADKKVGGVYKNVGKLREGVVGGAVE
jgi:hypothetical protein